VSSYNRFESEFNLCMCSLGHGHIMLIMQLQYFFKVENRGKYIDR